MGAARQSDNNASGDHSMHSPFTVMMQPDAPSAAISRQGPEFPD